MVRKGASPTPNSITSAETFDHVATTMHDEALHHHLFHGIYHIGRFHRLAPPIGGPALHDSSVKTVQWREREGHDSYQEVEICM